MFSSPPYAGKTLMGFALLLVSLVVFPLSLSAQDKSKASNGDQDDEIKLQTEEVSIPVTVRDRKSGNLVPNLDKKGFKIYEDGVQQQISFFSAERVPVNVVLLLDTSSSVQSEIDNIKTSAWSFIQQMGDNDKFSIISFTDTVDLMLDWTSDKTKARRALSNLSSGKFTAFNDALYLAATEQLQGIKGRKAIIVLSDGIDNRASTMTADQAYDAVMRCEANVYIVSKTAILRKRMDPENAGYRKPDGSLMIPVDNQELYENLKKIAVVLKDSEANLTKLSDDTGGRIYLPMSMNDLDATYKQV